MSEQNERSFLEERKAEYLAELRRREPELTAKFLWAIEAIEAFNSTVDVETPKPEPKPEPISETRDYSDPKLTKPLDAIEAFLDKEGKPATRDRITDSLALGGWGKDRVERPKWSLSSMLDYYLGLKDGSKPAKSTSEPRIKEINGLVGRIEWPDEEFTPEPPVLPEATPETQKERLVPKD